VTGLYALFVCIRMAEVSRPGLDLRAQLAGLLRASTSQRWATHCAQKSRQAKQKLAAQTSNTPTVPGIQSQTIPTLPVASAKR